MGTPTFASKALSAILKAGYPISCVYTRAPKPAGRGHKVITSSVYDLATEHNIEIETPKSFKRSAEEVQKFLDKKFDLVIVASYGLILPKSIIDAPKYGCFNIHGSLLPKWRGASPIQMSIASGDTETGITIMQMDEGLDTGNMLLKKSIPITSSTTFLSLYEELGDIGADLIVETLFLLKQDKLASERQDDSLSSHAPILNKEDGLINFNETALQINQKVRGFNPFPSTYFNYNGETIKILETEIITDINTSKYSIGEIISRGNNKELLIVCKNSVLKIIKLQRPSKKPMLTEELLNGFNFEIGYIIK